MARSLLKAGADPMARDIHGSTALDYARSSGGRPRWSWRRRCWLWWRRWPQCCWRWRCCQHGCAASAQCRCDGQLTRRPLLPCCTCAPAAAGSAELFAVVHRYHQLALKRAAGELARATEAAAVLGLPVGTASELCRSGSISSSIIYKTASGIISSRRSSASGAAEGARPPCPLARLPLPALACAHSLPARQLPRHARA
jgi:hypothetical protein